jgi:hypothetical protein
LYICWKLILPELDTASEQNAIIERLNYSVTAIGLILGPEEKPFQYPTFCLNKLPLTIENPSPSDGIYVPDKAIDGSLDPESIWSSFGIGAYITVDIGSIKTVCRVEIAWYEGDKRINHFVISASDNGANFTTIFTGDSSGTTTDFETYPVTNVNARYVKVTVNGNSEKEWADIMELTVFGTGIRV